MKKTKRLVALFGVLALFTFIPAKAESKIKHSMNFDIAYTYLITRPNAHMGTFGIGYSFKTDSNITFNLTGYGGYGKLLVRTGDITGFGVVGMKAMPGYALDITDSIYVNFAAGLGFSFTSSKIATAIVDSPASVVSIKMPIGIDFVFKILDNFDIVSGIQYGLLWQNIASFTNVKEEPWRVAHEISLLLSFKYNF